MAVEAVVSVVIHRLKNLLTEESKTFKKARDEVKNVLAELSNMQSISNNAENPEHSNQELQFLGKVYAVADAVESFVLAETYLKRSFVKKFCREPPEGMGCSKNISRLKYEMNRISNEIPIGGDGNPLLAEPHQGSHSRRHQQPGQDSDAYYAAKPIFKKEVKKLLTQLTSNSNLLQIVSVFGEEGIEKTAYVKTIYNKIKLRNFQCSALVVVNTKYSVRYLMMSILQQMTRTKVQKLNDEVLRGKLHMYLKKHKYLIVIIDIESLELLEELRGALPDAYNGSRVVITTSNREADLFADASNRYHFKPLDMEDSFNVFISKLSDEEVSKLPADRMEDLKNKIAESCQGVALRIGLLASLLLTRGVIYEKWSKVFEHRDFATKSPSFDMLVFCYNDVPMHLKPCLLYLALFRKGFEIPVRRLLRLWLAEGFVKPLRGMALEDIVEAYLEELVKRNLVEITKRRSDESPRKCRMIEALHDIVLPRALQIGFFHLHQKSDEHSNATAEHQFRIPRVVEYSNIEDYSSSKAFNQNIQSYISFNGGNKDMPAEEVEIFLKKIIGDRGFGLLKVLDLEGVYRPRLPENLGNLFHLKYLGLRWTFLETLPSSLGGLLYLETLDIKHTRVTTLPSSILNMKHLQHLCLNGARLDISAQSMKHRGPSQLETLWGLFVDENIARKFGLTLIRMTNLQKLEITTQSSATKTTTMATTMATSHSSTTTETSQSSPYEVIESWISLLYSLQSLRLRSKDKIGHPSELIVKPLWRLKNLSKLYLLGHLRMSLSWYQFPPGLKVLTLSVSKLGEDPLPTLSKLPNLIVLRLLASSYEGRRMHCPENGFPSLRVLKLWKLENLKVLSVHDGTMPKLQTMDIRCCIQLEELPPTLLQIKSFDKLILTNMPKKFVSDIKRRTPHTKIVVNKLDF